MPRLLLPSFLANDCPRQSVCLHLHQSLIDHSQSQPNDTPKAIAVSMDQSRRAIEAWTWYSVVWIVVGLRCVSRWVLRSTPISIEDFVIAFAMCTYTIAITCLYTYDRINSSLNYNNLTDKQAVYYGRKLGIINILAETSIQTTLWCIKACLLILYHRISFGTPQNFAIRVVAVYTACCFLVIIIVLYGGWCRPFSQYLLLSPEVDECLTWKHYNIVQLTLNLSSDLAIISVPISLIYKTTLTLPKKVMLIFVFGLGAFVMTAAILMKYSVFTDPTQPVWLPWSVREVSTAVLVGNLVSCIPVFRSVWGFFASNAKSVFTKSKDRRDPFYPQSNKVGEELGPVRSASTSHLPSNIV